MQMRAAGVLPTTDLAELPRRPSCYGHGPDIPVGVYRVVQAGAVFTVERRIQFSRWYPLTARDNPAWKVWRTRDEAQTWLNRMAGDLPDWRHWGRA